MEIIHYTNSYMTWVYSQFDIPLHQQKLKILNIIYNKQQ
jgi:hypothetical protein